MPQLRPGAAKQMNIKEKKTQTSETDRPEMDAILQKNLKAKSY